MGAILLLMAAIFFVGAAIFSTQSKHKALYSLAATANALAGTVWLKKCRMP